MRDYVALKIQRSGFNVTFTGQPVLVVSVGDDDDDVATISAAMLQQAFDQFPGYDFDGIYTAPAETIYLELDKHIVSRISGQTIAIAVSQEQILSGNYLLVSTNPPASAALDLDPAFFLKFITDVSPRSTWSGGK